MKTLKYFILAFVVLLHFGCEEEELPTEEWKLVWSDEFDGTSLDLTKWGYQLGDGSAYGLEGWGNNELQSYERDNVSVADGKLIIEGRYQSGSDPDYTSGRIWTNGLFDTKYGKIEASMKLPTGQGLWSAFWMLPTDNTGGWPKSGEIDIMEHLGHNPNSVLCTLHFGETYNNKGSTHASKPSTTYTTEFHTYTIEWEEDRIEWFIDNQSLLVSTPDDVGDFTWPFNQEFYLIFNMAIGGNLSNNSVNNSIFPASMEVDYVRVYEKI